MFAGELPADILDDVARHMTGAFDYILFKVTEEGVTLKPYVEEDGENTLSQAVTIFSQGENPAVYGGRESDTC